MISLSMYDEDFFESTPFAVSNKRSKPVPCFISGKSVQINKCLRLHLTKILSALKPLIFCSLIGNFIFIHSAITIKPDIHWIHSFLILLFHLLLVGISLLCSFFLFFCRSI